MTMRRWKVFGALSKPNLSIASTTQLVLRPKTPSSLILKAGITASVAIPHWAISAPNSSNNSFHLNWFSTQKVQGHQRGSMGLSQGLCLGNKQVNKRTSWSRLAWRLWVCTQVRTALDLCQEALSQMTTTTFLCSRRATVSRCGRKVRVSAELGWPEVKDSATCCVS